MKKILFLSILLATTVAIAQKETCDSPNEVLEDLNSITKCTIEPSKNDKSEKSRQISVRVSASKRYLKKRAIEKRDAATNVSGINASGVANTSQNTEITKNITLKTNLAALTNSLSAEEVRNADKFTTVDDIPQFNACKSKKKKDQMDCFNIEMIKHIQNHFSYPTEAAINKIEGEVWVRFIIDANGNVGNIKALGPKGGELLNDEATRVVSNLPKFEPGVKDGKATSVKYGFPINFALEDN